MKTPSIGTLKKKLWKVFADYVKKRVGGVCFTCGRTAEGMGYHAGHYIPKSICGIALYFHENNVHGQCFNCNINLGGNGRMYERAMLKKYGKKIVEDLDRKSREINKVDVEWYLGQIYLYSQKLAEL